MWNTLIPSVNRAGVLLLTLSAGVLTSAQEAVPVSAKEGSYAALVVNPENGPLVDAVLDAWMNSAGFEALRQHLIDKQHRADFNANEHAALALLWRRLNAPAQALEHWEKATAAEPKQGRYWFQRASQEARLQRFPQALASLGNISNPEETGDSHGVAMLLANLIRQTNENSARQRLHKWMEVRPDDVELWLDLTDMIGRFSGSEKQWLDRLTGWRKTVRDPALLSRIHLIACDELNNQGKPQEALTLVLEALAETKSGSKEEKTLLPMLVTLYRRSFNSNTVLKPGPLELARANKDRPDLALSLAAVVEEQGGDQELLKLLNELSVKHPHHGGLTRARLAELEELGLYDEAAAVLQSQQAEDPVALALLYRDAGLQEKALAAIEKLPDTDFTRVVRAVISGEKLALTPVAEMAPTEEVNPPEPPSWQAGLEVLPLPEKTARLFDLWSAEPLNEGIAKALIANWSQAGKTAEAEHVCMSVFKRLQTPLAQRRWCQSLVGGSAKFDLYRTLLKQGANLPETAGYWLGLSSAVEGNGMEQQAGALLEAAERMPGDEALLLQFQAAEALLAQRQLVQAAEVATGLIGTAQDAAARLLLARIDLLEGHVNQARRVLWSLAADEAMTANQAGAFASGLLYWHEKADADAFLALQRRRFPDEPSLLMLQLFSLRQNENSEERIQSLLDMGMVRLKEPPQQSMRINTPEGKLSPEEIALSEWWALQSALSNEDHFQHEHLDYFAAAGLSNRRYSYLWNQSTSAHLRSWAMAQLLRHAEEARLDQSARKELSLRAQKAGLPLPGVLVWARLETDENGTNRLVPNLELLEDLPVEEWLIPVAGHFHQRLARHSGDMRPLSAQENRVLEKLTLALRKNASPESLTLGFRWWRAQLDSAEAKAAIIAEFDSKDRLPERLPQTLVTLLAELTPEQRKDAVLASVPAALAAWLSANEGSAKYFGADGFAAAHCYLLLGRWQEAAKWAERSWLLPGAPGAPTPEPPQPSRLIPAWLFPEAQPVLSWPPSDALLGLLRPTPFLSAPSQPFSPTQSLINESERSAFLSAAENLTHKPLRLLWLLKGEDQTAAKAMVGTWLLERPEDPIALRLTACLEAAEGRRDEALDILHSMISTRPPGSSERYLAQSLYLRSALLPSSPVPRFRQRNEHMQPPPPKHLERVRQTLLELLPEIEKWPEYKASWFPAYKAAGLADAVVSWERPANMSMSAEESEGWTTGPYVRDSRQRRLLDEAYQPRRISSYEVSRLLESGKQDQAFTLMMRGLREEADQHFLRRSSGGSDWAQLLLNPDHKARLLQLAQALPRRSPRELNHALHIAEVCGDWRQLVDWAVAGGSLLDSNPYLQSRLDLARLELGGSVAELAGKLTETPATQRREKFRHLMGALASSRSFHQRLRLAELFVVMAEAPSADEMLKEGDRSSITQSVFHALTSAFVLPQNVGSVPPLYPELVTGSPEKQPSPPPPDITPADLDKRRQLHSRLCDLSLKSDAWLRHSMSQVVQRHLMENQPSEEVLKNRIKAMQSSPMGGNYMVDQLAQSGQGWRDMTPRLKLARLLMQVIQSTETPTAPDGWNQPQRDRLDSLMTLMGAEVPAASFPPLWALWEFPHDSLQVKHPHTPQQTEWNKERQKLFEELCDWAMEQPRYRASVFPKWAGYRLHFPDTDTLILKRARELKEQLGDPFSMRGFVQTAMLAYSNGHHVRSADIVLALMKESPSLAADSSLLSDVVTLLLKGRSNQAEPMPPLSLRPEDTDPATHDLTSDQQHRRIELIEELSLMDGSNALLPPALLLARLEKAVTEGSDTTEIKKNLIQLGKASPTSLAEQLSAFLIQGHSKWRLNTESRIHSILISTADDWLPSLLTDRTSTSWLDLMIKYHLDIFSQNSEITRLPSSLTGGGNTPQVEGPPTINEAVALMRDQSFDRLLAILSKYPQHQETHLPLRLQRDLSNRQSWPSLLSELKEFARQDANDCNNLLNAWLGLENISLDNERLEILRDFLLKWIPLYAEHSEGQGLNWFWTAGDCFLNHSEGRFGRKPKISLVIRGFSGPVDRFAYGDVYADDSGYPEAEFRRNAFIQLIRAAVDYPVYQSFCFPWLTVATLESETENLARLAQKLSGEPLVKTLEILLYDLNQRTSQTRLRQRVATVRLLLRIPGLITGVPAVHMPDAVSLPEVSLDVLKRYLEKEESTTTKQPSDQDLHIERERDALLKELEALASMDPRTSVSRRMTALFAELAARDLTVGDVEELLLLKEQNPSGVKLVIKEVLDDQVLQLPAMAVGLEQHRVRMMTLIISMLERLPNPSDLLDTTPWHAFTRLLTQPNPEVIKTQTGRLLLERLMSLAERSQDAGASFFGTYAFHQCQSEEGRAHLLRRVLANSSHSSEGLNGILKGWHLPARNQSNFGSAAYYANVLRFHLTLLTHCPDREDLDSFRWLRTVIEYASHAETKATSYQVWEFEGTAMVPEPPPDSDCRILLGEIYELAESRKALPQDWLIPARLRLQSRSYDTLEERATELKESFSTDNQPILIRYWDQVIDAASKHRPMPHSSYPSQNTVHRDLVTWELYDALRSLAGAAHSKLMRKEELSRLHAKAVEPSRRLAAVSTTVLSGLSYQSRAVHTMPNLHLAQEEFTLALQGDPADLPLAPETLNAYLIRAQKNKEPYDRIAQAVRSLALKKPTSVDDALRTWVNSLIGPAGHNPDIQIVSLITAIGDVWTDDLPPPMWLIEFCKNWNPSGKMRKLDPTLPSVSNLSMRLAAVLLRFSQSPHPDYFPCVSKLIPVFGPPDTGTLKALAERHLDALIESGGVLEISPSNPEASEISFSSHAVLFLTIHAWRSGQTDFQKSDLHARLVSRLNSPNKRRLAALEGMCFGAREEFATQAQEWLTLHQTGLQNPPAKSHIPWVLHIADLRQMALTWAEWRQLRPPSDHRLWSESTNGDLSFWLEHLLKNGENRFADPLTAYLRDVIASAPSRSATQPPLFDARQILNPNWAGLLTSPFGDTLWNWIWNTLNYTARKNTAWLEILLVADALGFMQDAPLATLLVRFPYFTTYGNFNDQEWFAWLESAGLLADSAEVRPLWLSSWKGRVPLWQMGMGLSSDFVPDALARLKTLQSEAPSLGRALLRLSLLGRQRQLEPRHLKRELGPVVAQVKALSPAVRTSLVTALQLRCPGLRVHMAAESNDAVWGALSLLSGEPPKSPEIQFWTQPNPKDVKWVDLGGGSAVQRLAWHLNTLLHDGYPETEAHFLKAVARLEEIEADQGVNRRPKAKILSEVLTQIWHDLHAISLPVNVPVVTHEKDRALLAMARLMAATWPGDTAGWPRMRSLLPEEAIVTALSSNHPETLHNGRGLALELIGLTSQVRPESSLAFLDAFTSLLGRLPASTSLDILSFLDERAEESPAHEILSWTMNCAWHQHKLLTTRSSDIGKRPPLLDRLLTQWKSHDTPLLIRLWIHHAAPEETAAFDPVALLDLGAAVFSASSEAEWLVGPSKLDLRPLKEVPLSPALSDSLRALSAAFKNPDKQGAIYRGSRPPNHTELQFVERGVIPILHLLHRLDDADALSKALHYFASGNFLFAHHVMEEALRAPDHAPVWLTAYNTVSPQRPPLPWAQPLPSLTAENVKIVEQLTHAKSFPSRQALRLLLLAGPDDEAHPPPISQEERWSGWAKASPAELAAARAILLRIPLETLQELPALPVFESLPFISSFFDAKETTPQPPPQSVPELPLLSAYALLRWIQNNDTAPMLKLARLTSPSSAADFISFGLSRRLHEVVCIGLAHRLRSASPTQLLNDARLLEELSRHVQEVSALRDYRFFLAAAGALAPPENPIWSQLDTAFDKAIAASTSGPSPYRSLPLWTAVADSQGLDIQTRLQILSSVWNTASRLALPEYFTDLQYAVETGLLTPGTVAESVNLLSTENLVHAIPYLANWLHMAELKDAAQRLIERALSTPIKHSFKNDSVAWAMVADFCRTNGLPDLLPVAVDRCESVLRARPNTTARDILYPLED